MSGQVTQNVCSNNFDSYKVLRGVPQCGVNGKNETIWYAVIVGTPGKTPDPNNSINLSTFQTNIPSPETATGEAVKNVAIVDSTHIIVQNLINGSCTPLDQEDAFNVFSGYDSAITTATGPCTVAKPPGPCADGVLQFLSLISIAPSVTWLGTGLVITISPLANNPLYANCTYGNWCPFSFSIGNCNTSSASASVLYLTCPAGPSGIGYSYYANYANIKFTLLNKCKVATVGTKKAYYLGVDSLDKNNFLVFFGQQRLIGSCQILLVSPIVDLRCIIWQPVFLLTTNTPLTISCGVPQN
jgi:hypothetical protein